MILHAILHPVDKQGWIVIECPALPGCISQGRNEEEALANIKEAANGWMWAEERKAAGHSTDGKVHKLITV